MTPDAQQPQRECDGDCLSCDTDTYISCEKRINPDMKYTALERLDIKFSELIGAIEEKQVDGQLSSKDHGDYELICYCRGFIKAELERERRTRPHTPAPTDEQCRICSEAIRNKTMDEFGILHGKDAKRFHDYINNPPEETPKSKAMIKQAYEISKTISLDPDHDAAIARAATLAENKHVYWQEPPSCQCSNKEVTWICWMNLFK